MKMNQKRSVWSIFIMLFLAAFVCCISPVEVRAEDAVVETKEEGNFTYTRYASGLCVISGSGELKPGNTGKSVINNASSVKIEGATSIGEDAFSFCSMTQVIIPGSVTSIGDYAFSYCTNLTEVTIPNSVTSIGYDAFYGCSSIKTAGPIGSESNLEIGNYQNLPESFFSSFKYLTEVTIPNSVTSIGFRTFSGCSSLTQISIPDSVTSIEDYAFYICNNLTQVTIPNSVTSIGESAFEECSNLTQITIPNSMMSIGDYAFLGCSSLKIKGYKNTYAEEYANANNIPFVSIGTVYKVYFNYDAYAPNDSVVFKIVIAGEKYGMLPEIDSQYADMFCGWYTSKTNGEKITADTIADLSGDTVLHARVHTVNEVEMVAATCTTNGNIAYWQCDSCNKYFSDENFSTEITNADIVIKAKGHDLEIIEGLDATCTQSGHNTQYVCKNCGKSYINKACTTESTVKNLIIPAKGHNVTQVNLQPATMKSDGKTAGTKCSTCGTILSGCETIPKLASVSLSAATYKWDGKVKTPVLTITASDGTTIPAAYYTVTKSSGRKNVGKYAYKVTFKGNYSGTKSLSFTINPKGATQTKPAALAKGFTAKWKKVSTKMSSSRITGYQVRYSMRSNMASSKIKTVSGYSKTSIKITKLKPKKKYYIQVRTYKTVNKVKYYSTWSAKKTVITK